MPAAVRSYVTAGVALVGASVISVSPVVPNLAAAQQEVRSVTMDVNLSAQSVANIGPNLINMFLSMPQANVDAVNYFAKTWSLSGNWWVYSQDNILGWDRRNPAMAWSFVDLLLPIPALSKPYGEAMQWWMAANLPQHQGCSGLPPCPNYENMLSSMFRVPGWEFYDEDGYTFGPDGFTPQYDQISENEHYWGYELGEEGDPVEWYGQTVKLDPFAGWKSLVNYLMEDPQPLKFPTLQETFTAWARFGEALSIMFNPFVPQSYIWNPRYSLSAYLFRPFAKYLCPSCNKYDPFMPPDWKPSDGFPTPVDDGWQDDNAQTPTGLPLPTEDDPSDVSLLTSAKQVVNVSTDQPENVQPVQDATTDLVSTPVEESVAPQPGTEEEVGTAADESAVVPEVTQPTEDETVTDEVSDTTNPEQDASSSLSDDATDSAQEELSEADDSASEDSQASDAANADDDEGSGAGSDIGGSDSDNGSSGSDNGGSDNGGGDNGGSDNGGGGEGSE